MKITVVTVVLNAAEKLKKTIESVTAQDHNDIEYIIKDGGSADGSLELIKKAASEYPYIKYVSAPDNGIYDAMNQALRTATGDYVHFLNAGETYASESVISLTAIRAEASRALILYGDIIYINGDGSREIRSYGRACSSRLYYLTGDCINHQAIFAARKLFKNEHFDISYSICADREWMMRIHAYSGGIRMECLGFPVACYALDGVSVVNKAQYRAETDRCIREHMEWGYPVFAVFEFMRNNDALAKVLHTIYRKIFINRRDS